MECILDLYPGVYKVNEIVFKFVTHMIVLLHTQISWIRMLVSRVKM